MDKEERKKIMKEGLEIGKIDERLDRLDVDLEHKLYKHNNKYYIHTTTAKHREGNFEYEYEFKEITKNDFISKQKYFVNYKLLII